MWRDGFDSNEFLQKRKLCFFNVFTRHIAHTPTTPYNKGDIE